MKHLTIFLYLISSLIALFSSSTCFAQIPIPAGYPNSSNTGIAGVGLTINDLTPTSGRDITADGTVIDMENVNGTLNIKANNVTIKRCRIKTGGYYGVRIYGGYRGTVIEDCLLVGNAGSVNITGTHYTARRCEIYGDHDGLKLNTGVLVEDCYLHDQLKETGTHNDAMQDSGGSSNYVVRHNSIIGPYRQSTSAIIMNTNFGPIDNVLIEDNFISGGGYSVYCNDKGTGYGPPTNVTFRNNVFELGSFTYNHVTYDGTPTFECNTFSDGTPIPENPACASDGSPVANAGPDQLVSDANDNGSETVTLDGTASYDNDGLIVSYVWTENASTIATGQTTQVVLAVGIHDITLTVTDNDGKTASDDVRITINAAGEATSDIPWQSFSLPTQTDVFTVEFDARPNMANMNGVTGFLRGVADEYDDLACIMRFDSDGRIDVRNADVYQEDTSVSYSPGVTYHFRFDIDIPAHRYSVFVTPPGQQEITLASNYAFRSTQSSVTQLDHWALQALEGSHTISNMRIGSDSPIVARHIFYNNSAFDGYDPTANSGDDYAIASDKTPLLPGETAAFANYTSYEKGINGIMIDLADAPASVSSDDFVFAAGNDTSPQNWQPAPSPQSITVRPGEGVDGSDRITITFADNAIRKQWLKVTFKANTNTGLEEDDVFYLGNAVGDTGDSASHALVDATDEINARNNPRHFANPADIDDLHDFNRDGKVDATDEIIARNNTTNLMTGLVLLTAP